MTSSSADRLQSALYIVGAGPGDPDLLTLKAYRLIAQADVILFADSLIPEEILQIARPDAEIIRTADQSLEQIVPLMVARVRSQYSVVRLHSGDPCLYSAVQEQLEAIAAAQNPDETIPVEIVPGISAYQLAAARLQVELTIPELVQTVILSRISGRTQVPEAEELSSLAAHRASLCLYLSAKHVQRAQVQLMQHYAADTPVAICYRLGWEDERIWLVPLGEMAAVTAREGLVRTTMYVVSEALRGIGSSTSSVTSSTISSTTNSVTSSTTNSVTNSLIGQRRSRLYNPDYPRLFREEVNLVIQALAIADQSIIWEMLRYAAHESSVAAVKTQPALARYAIDWGRKGDLGCVATVAGEPVGAAWLRLWTGEDRGFGFVAAEIPELAIAVLPDYRGRGIGTRLLNQVLTMAKDQFTAVSLSVRSDNPVVKLYERVGFARVDDSEVVNRADGSSFSMVRQL
jgi:precorrin-4/cobalt-precorrin-4 C11-methyltransferase